MNFRKFRHFKEAKGRGVVIYTAKMMMIPIPFHPLVLPSLNPCDDAKEIFTMSGNLASSRDTISLKFLQFFLRFCSRGSCDIVKGMVIKIDVWVKILLTCDGHDLPI